jgi:hypothetical protein
MGFTKLDSKIRDSSIWEEPSDVLKLFFTFCTMSDPEGNVRATIKSIYRNANIIDKKTKEIIPFADFETLLAVLMKPDLQSRSKSHEGKRIILLAESHWFIVNYAFYRQFTYSDNPESERKREQRSKNRGTRRDMSQSVPGHSASVSASASESEKKGIKLDSGIIIPFSFFQKLVEICQDREQAARIVYRANIARDKDNKPVENPTAWIIAGTLKKNDRYAFNACSDEDTAPAKVRAWIDQKIYKIGPEKIDDILIGN